MMTDADRSEKIAEFDDAKALLSFGAACVGLADLDFLAAFYERASSPQEVASGSVSISQSLIAGRWRDLVQAALVFRESTGPIDEDALAVVKEIVLSARVDAPTTELVVEWAACPNCGERRMDQLTINNESVDCATCGRRYVLPNGRR